MAQKRAIVATLLVAVLVAVNIEVLAAADVQGPAEWKEFASKPGGFVVSFPGAPKEQAVPVKGRTQQMFVVERGGTGFAVSYQIEPRPIEKQDTESLMKLIREKLAGVKHKILDERGIMLAKHPGVELLLKSSAGKYLRHRVYFVQNRLLQVIHGPRPDVEGLFDADAKTFFQSFKLAE